MKIIERKDYLDAIQDLDMPCQEQEIWIMDEQQLHKVQYYDYCNDINIFYDVSIGMARIYAVCGRFYGASVCTEYFC